MRKLLSAMMVIFTMGMTGSVCAQDLTQAFEAYLIDKDYAKALKEFKFSADRGSAQAQYWLGHMYGSGEGVKLDYKEAVFWYRKAAEQGYPTAQNALGFLYQLGRGVI